MSDLLIRWPITFKTEYYVMGNSFVLDRLARCLLLPATSLSLCIRVPDSPWCPTARDLVHPTGILNTSFLVCR